MSLRNPLSPNLGTLERDSYCPFFNLRIAEGIKPEDGNAQ